jgi:transposase-like protein
LVIGPAEKEVAWELDIEDTSLGSWVRQWEKTASARQVESAKEEAWLGKWVCELEKQIEILNGSTRYLVKDGQ